MKILAIDTSGTSGSIALSSGADIMKEITTTNVGTHSKWLMPAIDSLLTEEGVTPKDIDLFAVGQGPGSFTGLRIGISIVKGLSWSFDKPIIGVSTLHAMAMNVEASSFKDAPEDGPIDICPVLDARKKEVYAALFRLDSDGLTRVVDDIAIKPLELTSLLKEKGQCGKTLFIGGGVDVYGEDVFSDLPGAVMVPTDKWPVRASNVVHLALENTDKKMNAAALIPYYLRKSEAEIKKKASA